jgi:hypothetical protein
MAALGGGGAARPWRPSQQARSRSQHVPKSVPKGFAAAPLLRGALHLTAGGGYQSGERRGGRALRCSATSEVRCA